MPVIDLSSDDTDQVLVGFGGAFTETSATVFYKLSPTRQREILDMYFGLDGLGYTLGRTHINSCDFSLSSYSFDEVPGDVRLAHFDGNLRHDVESGLIPLIKAAQEKIASVGRALKLLASPWSPPAWMKTNGQMDGDGGSGTDNLITAYYEPWARYMEKWIAAHKAQDIPIWAITIQNEPMQNQRWESAQFTVEQEVDFLANYLGPIVKGSHPEVDIYAYDMFKPHIHEWAEAVYSHADASKYAAGIAWHWYSGDLFSLVDKVHRSYPQAKLLPSELTYEQVKWAPGTKVEDGDWSFGEGYGHDIIGNLNAGAIGWIDWNLILDPTGGPNHMGNVCDSAIMANTTTGHLFIHPQYFYIGHFSKYILPGSQRIRSTLEGTAGPVSLEDAMRRGYGVCTAEDGLQATAFRRPDGHIVAVVLNCAGEAIDFKLRDRGRVIKGSIPPHGIQTYMFESMTSS